MKKNKKVKTCILIKVPTSLYEDYKRVLHKDSRIVTYDLLNYMQKVVNKDLEKK
ncbi:transcriptional regulator [Lactobacillus huangpiensis]|uniref:transcriptional regulator n=1 Tax=Lactobacillus huangpiensis TaxID=2799571 RepID=UPI001CC4C74A|nr:transcriptional regulator [Lactobacillus huangpiensis]